MNPPPFTITATILNQVATISESLGRLSVQQAADDLRLRRINRIRTVQGSLAIEGNHLSEEQITAILAGKRVIAPPRDVQEAQNALQAYDRLDNWQPTHEGHLLEAHATLMMGLIDEVGRYRRGGVGVMSGSQVIHVAPPADRVPLLMSDLFAWLRQTDQHPLISSCVFHYEFEFIHPFADGNGRMGRLWQTLLLSRWNPLFAHVPVESLVHRHQDAYYQAIGESTRQTDSAPFIEFMLGMIQDALRAYTPEVAPEVAPEVVRLLALLQGEMGRAELMAVLGLKDEKHFREHYQQAAIAKGLIEMTIPDKPRSRLQKYRLTLLGKQVLAAKDQH
jgi:Fic family protein